MVKSVPSGAPQSGGSCVNSRVRTSWYLTGLCGHKSTYLRGFTAYPRAFAHDENHGVLGANPGPATRESAANSGKTIRSGSIAGAFCQQPVKRTPLRDPPLGG
jgi:hypothetical protein